MNNTIIQELTKLVKELKHNLYETGNKTLGFKIRTYNKTIEIIKDLNFEIKKSSQLEGIKGIGKGTLEKIDTIIKNGSLGIIQEKTSDDKSVIIDNLIKVTGIGPSKALKLYNEGVTLEKLLSIDIDNPDNDSLNFIDTLTHHQVLGIKYYHHLEKRIPYGEITKIKEYLKNEIKKIETDLEIVICGSYRRQKKNSGDIDVLIYHNKLKTKKDIEKTIYLYNFLDHLTNNNFIVDNLTSIDNPTKYMGFCKLKGHKYIRRIDIRMVAYESLATALMYFTGSGDFNKNMRTYALQKDYTLNEYGLYKLKNKVKTFKIKTENENDIFRILGLDYVAPENRIPSYKF